MKNITTTKKHILRQSILMLLALISSHSAMAQKKVLDHDDFAIWKTIGNERISNDGNFVAYQLDPGEGDPSTHIFRVSDNTTASFERSSGLQFTADSKYAVFKIAPAQDSLKSLKRQKAESDEYPNDTLAIVDLSSMSITYVPDVRSFNVPDKWATHIAYTLSDPVAPKMEEEDTADEKADEKTDNKKKKEHSGKNGYMLIVRELTNNLQDTLDFTTDYEVAEAGMGIAAVSTGHDSTLKSGVYYYGGLGFKLVKGQKGKYEKLSLNQRGTKLAFLGDVDTTKARIRPWQLYLWQEGLDSAVVYIDSHEDFMPDGWLVSEHGRLKFSEDGDHLHLGIAPEPILQDTSLLQDDIVNVEVWHYLDEMLYTQQSVRSKEDRERTFLTVVDLATDRKMLVADSTSPETITDRKANSRYILTTNSSPYRREASWTGITKRDVYVFDLETGTKTLSQQAIDGRPSVSPADKYISWYSRQDSAWIIESIDGNISTSSKDIPAPMYDILNDRPMLPTANGSAGWTKDDAHLLLNSTYDIWKLDPTGNQAPVNLTNGAKQMLRYRFIDLDPEEEFIDASIPMLLYVFNESTKESGYALLDLATGELTSLIMQKARFDSRPKKAKDEDIIVFTRETFTEFPDLHITADHFESEVRISEANPQQSEYRWGTAELFRWKAYDGKQLEGVIIKPDNFDPSKQYPVIVNFYERSSDRLYNHRAPYPHRSTINYSFYASRGYVIFNPDVIYDIGHPGKSAYNCVVSGVDALINEGYVDTERIGVQGHSWGGYQIADLITRTDIFACAESGAPVVNMISAYGGIRWGSGLSRMFQYEHTQSRIGATLWELPGLYIENSPIFSLDKVTTPVLILHNDKDGAVPWYQGIEFFVAMRRLGKPAWMLNYNDEPHWPLKLQNRKDFNIRMQQFFDHYLMNAPMPKWMEEGVPAIYKGILQGYEAAEPEK